ncbi:hypothetical protein KNV38_gp002 [uncultured phage cr111_1]|uniref:Uncharacterized protein n=1 Tax=uncultured phage cr111_1 TaxID=2772071 RepID=A0A7M1RYX3_9CAUD|nr:hypothetical protein KNV38_gp002 [uncultured phage cr111_1]QOR59122.1 hypothetical protein [uncultured phage cr111_1]
MFTRQDILEIAKKLKLISIRDSEFEKKESLDESDEVSILRKMPDETYSNYRIGFKKAIEEHSTKVEVVQETGNSTEKVMSQDAVTRALLEKVGSGTIKGVEVVYGTAPSQIDNILYIELAETN